MTRSAPLPPGVRLAVVLQELKSRTGLSLAQLAEATTFSKSSWQRYLNGGSLPPRSAVGELCRLAGEPADRPLALLDIARTDRTQETEPPVRRPPGPQRTGTRTDPPTRGPSPAEATVPPDTGPSETARTDTGPMGTAPTDTLPAPTRTAPAPHRRTTLLTVLASLCAVALGVIVLFHLPPPHREQAPPPPTPASATGALCRHTSCQNKDPITTRCGAQPQTLAEHETATGAWIQIRYSPECGTRWARMWGAAVNDRVEIRSDSRNDPVHSARVTSRNEADTYVHTLMSVTSPGTSTQACFTPAAGGAKECFKTPTDHAPTGTTP